MKAPICPYCGHKLAHLRSRYNAPQAIRKVLKRARKPTGIRELSEVYSELTGAQLRSARRAIERLAQQGILERVNEGYYQVR